MEALIGIIMWAFVIVIIFSVASFIVSIVWGVFVMAVALLANIVSGIYRFIRRGFGYDE